MLFNDDVMTFLPKTLLSVKRKKKSRRQTDKEAKLKKLQSFLIVYIINARVKRYKYPMDTKFSFAGEDNHFSKKKNEDGVSL